MYISSVSNKNYSVEQNHWSLNFSALIPFNRLMQAVFWPPFSLEPKVDNIFNLAKHSLETRRERLGDSLIELVRWTAGKVQSFSFLGRIFLSKVLEISQQVNVIHLQLVNMNLTSILDEVTSLGWFTLHLQQELIQKKRATE